MRNRWLYRVKAVGLAALLCAGAPGLARAELSAAQIEEIERLLARLNFDPGPVDGVVDERTHTAIRLYQEFAALRADGEPSEALLGELRAVADAFTDLRATQQAAQAVQALDPPAAAPAPAPEAPAAGADAPVMAEAEPAAPAPAPEEHPHSTPEPVAVQTEPTAPTPASEEPAAKEEVAVAETAKTESVLGQVEPEPAPVPGTPAVVAKTMPPGEPEHVAGDTQAPGPDPDDAPAGALLGEPVSDTAKSVQPEDAAEGRVPQATAAETPPASSAPELAAPAEQARAPEPETSPPAPGKPVPAPAPKEASKFSLDGMISRLVKARDQGGGAEPGPAKPAAAPPQQGQAPALTEAKPPAQTRPERAQTARAGGGAIDGYAAYRKAYAATQAQDFDVAVDFYTRAIDSGGLTLEHLAHALYNRANAQHYKGAYDRAIADYDAAISNKPNFPDAYYNRGFAYQAMGDQQRAVADFQAARDLGLQRLGVRSPDIAPPLP